MNQPLLLNAIVIDDEINARTNLISLLNRYCNSIRVIADASSADEGASLVNFHKPHVIFLDISMPKKNGFELINQLRFYPSIVFVTAHEEFALRAIKASALDFLLKPVDIHELQRVEFKLLKMHELKQQYQVDETYNAVLENVASMISDKGKIKTITVPASGGFEIISVHDIMYLEGENNYTTLFTIDNRKLMVSRTLKDYEEILSGQSFFRIHKSTIINLQFLQLYSSRNGTEVKMKDQKIFPVSRRRAPELLEQAKQFLEKH